MKAAMIRTYSLTLAGPGSKTLDRMEAHGKRLDRFSKARVVRPVDPLVYGSLDLRDAYDVHMEGVQLNAALKRPVLHSIIKFPGDLEVTQEHQQLMLEAAVKFVNLTHGGNAVFAARLDRDEAGEHNVDVFYAPKFEKTTTARKSDPDAGIKRGDKLTTTWMSTTKHGKELCEKHRAEIEARNDEGQFSTTPRSVGIALQSELFEFLQAEGLDVAPRQPKTALTPDWQETEAWKRTQDLKAAELAAKKAAADREQRLAAAEQQSAEIVEAARLQAAQLVAQAQGEVEDLREAAHVEGLEAGRAEAAEELSALRASVERLRGQFSYLLEKVVAAIMGPRSDRIVVEINAADAEAEMVLHQVEDALPPAEDALEETGPGF